MPPRPPPKPGAIHLLVAGPIGGAEAAALCDRVRAALGGGQAHVVVCDVGAVNDPDIGTVDALARAQLTAGRLGCQLRLDRASSELRDLIALVGLRAAVRCEPQSDLEARGQTKSREEPCGIKEEGDPADPTS